MNFIRFDYITYAQAPILNSLDDSNSYDSIKIQKKYFIPCDKLQIRMRDVQMTSKGKLIRSYF